MTCTSSFWINWIQKDCTKRFWRRLMRIARCCFFSLDYCNFHFLCWVLFLCPALILSFFSKLLAISRLMIALRLFSGLAPFWVDQGEFRGTVTSEKLGKLAWQVDHWQESGLASSWSGSKVTYYWGRYLFFMVARRSQRFNDCSCLFLPWLDGLISQFRKLYIFKWYVSQLDGNAGVWEGVDDCRHSFYLQGTINS